MARKGTHKPGAHRGMWRIGLRVAVKLVRVALILGILGGAGYGLFLYVRDTDTFRVRTIRITGTQTLSVQTISRQAGVTNADNIFLVSPAVVSERVLRLPYVKTCRVSRIYPDIVCLTIQERTPAITLLADNHLFEIDDECVVLREVGSDAVHTGPLITNVPDLGAIEPGRHIRHRALQEAVAVWLAFSATAMSRDVTVSEISAPSDSDIRMYCDELAYEIRWGRGGYANQAKRLSVLWKAKNKNIGCSEYVDLRFGRDLACR